MPELHKGDLVTVSAKECGAAAGVVLEARPPAELPAIEGQCVEQVRLWLEDMDVDQVALIEHRHEHRQVVFLAIHQRGSAHWRDLHGNLLTIEPAP